MPEKLKKGWTRVAFGDVVRLCRERSSKPEMDGFDRYVGLEHLDPGEARSRTVCEGWRDSAVWRQAVQAPGGGRRFGLPTAAVARRPGAR